jgi:DNA-binding transcriptional LysR family regulator
MTEPLPIALLEILITVGETRSFTDAAVRLSVTKATVSRGIAKLEEIVGEMLVFRNSHRVELTPVGLTLFERAAPSIKSLRGVRDALKPGDNIAGNVRVACSPEVAAEILSPIIERFTRTYPGVRFDLVSPATEAHDLEIRPDCLEKHGAGKRLLFSRLCAYAKSAYDVDHGLPAGLDDRRHRWVVKPVHDALRFPIMNIVVNDYVTAMRVLQRGGTIGFLPAFMGDRAVERGELMRIDIPGFDPRGGFLMLHAVGDPLPVPAQRFIDFLLDATANASQS